MFRSEMRIPGRRSPKSIETKLSKSDPLFLWSDESNVGNQQKHSSSAGLAAIDATALRKALEEFNDLG